MDQHWKALWNALGIGIVIVDEDWSLRYANRLAAELLGCSDEGELEACWRRLTPWIRTSFGIQPQLLAPGAGANLDLAEDAPFPHLRLEHFLLDGEGGQRALIVRDRDRRPAETPDLIMMSRYHMLARLYRSLRHDLKAPLQAMILNLELLKTSIQRNIAADPAIAVRQQRYIKALEDDLARLDRSLMSFLYQAVPPAQDTPTRFCLRELLLDVAMLIAPQAGKQRVAMEVEAGEQAVNIEGHNDLLKQALLNIGVNALEAMADGGRLTIKLETAMGRAIILFQDTGCGIPPEVVDRIWDLNYTTRKTGSGVGLYIARSVIESHGGAIGVETRDGQGCCFTLTLPIALEGG